MLIGGTDAAALHHWHWDAPNPSNRPLASAGVHWCSLAFTAQVVFTGGWPLGCH